MMPLHDGHRPVVVAGGRPPAGLLRARFGEIDSGRDGAVSFAEFERHHQATMQESFRTLDRNGDGRVARSEFEAVTAPEGPASEGELPAPGFDAIDADKDGFLSLQELHG